MKWWSQEKLYGKGAAADQHEAHSLRLKLHCRRQLPGEAITVTHPSVDPDQTEQNLQPSTSLPKPPTLPDKVPTKTEERTKNEKRHRGTVQLANIVHEGRFEVTLTHLSKRLKIYNSLDITYGASPGAARNVEHVGTFAGLSNKGFALPEHSEGNRSISIHLRLRPLFDFFQANAVRAGLRVENSNGETSYRKDRGIYQKYGGIMWPKDSLFVNWLVPVGKDTRGKFTISLQRVIQLESDGARYQPLARDGKGVYTLEVEWHVCAAPQKIPNLVGTKSMVADVEKNKPTLHTPQKKKKFKTGEEGRKAFTSKEAREITKKLRSPRKALSGVNFVQVLRGEVSAQDYNASRLHVRGPFSSGLGRQRVRQTRLLPSLTSSPPTPTPLPRRIAAPREEAPKEAAPSNHTPSPSAFARGLMRQGFHLFPKPEKDDEDDVGLLKGRPEEAKANLKVVRLRLKIMTMKKGIPYGQDEDGDFEYWGMELDVAKAESDVARLETMLRTAALKETRRSKRP